MLIIIFLYSLHALLHLNLAEFRTAYMKFNSDFRKLNIQRQDIDSTGLKYFISFIKITLQDILLKCVILLHEIGSIIDIISVTNVYYDFFLAGRCDLTLFKL